MILIPISLQANEVITPPVAKRDPANVDPYHWLNKRDNQNVLNYLNAENEYTKQKMASTVKLQDTLFEEFKNRIKEDDNSVPYRKGNYFYYVRYEKNKSYPLYCRKKNNLENPEEIMLDVNELAKDHEFYNVGTLRVSPNENLLAFAEDTQGRRKYTIRIKDLTTQKYLNDVIKETQGTVEWANNSSTLFYVNSDPITLRANQILQHKLNHPVTEDRLVYEEKDDTYYCELSKTKSKKFLMISSINKTSTEYQILDADHPDEAFSLFSKRQKGIEYYIENLNDKFIIRTNLNAPNFTLMQCELTKTQAEHWKPFIAYNDSTYTNDFDVFDNFLAIQQRIKGLDQIQIYPLNKNKPYYIPFDEPDYSASVVSTPEMSSNEVRFTYSSLKTPTIVYDFNISTKQKILKKQQEVLAGFKTDNYTTDRRYAKANDGTAIPISLVYRNDKFASHKNPLLITGYGSYGMSYDSEFDPYVISLLDRGFVYAIAHIRGGSELGSKWYAEGKLLKKKNTFTDFINSTVYLEKAGFGASGKLYASGGSAGGLLIGAVINMEPHLFNGVIAQVPFVDVINTMIDPNIPLTTSEYAEWGDPKDKQYYEYILSYSPYDNVSRSAYPNILVTAGYHDSQVQYWESAKWVAKLRSTKTDNNLLLLKTNMTAGHSGASGRYDAYREKAFEYAFLLSLQQ